MTFKRYEELVGNDIRTFLGRVLAFVGTVIAIVINLHHSVPLTSMANLSLLVAILLLIALCIMMFRGYMQALRAIASLRYGGASEFPDIEKWDDGYLKWPQNWKELKIQLPKIVDLLASIALLVLFALASYAVFSQFGREHPAFGLPIMLSVLTLVHLFITEAVYLDFEAITKPSTLMDA